MSATTQASMDQKIEVECPICQAKMPQQYINSHIDSVHPAAMTPPLQVSPTAASSRNFCQLALSGARRVTPAVVANSTIEQKRAEPSPKRVRLSHPFVADATAALSAATDLTFDDGFVVIGQESTPPQCSSGPQPSPSEAAVQSQSDGAARQVAPEPAQTTRHLSSAAPEASANFRDLPLQPSALEQILAPNTSALERPRSVLSESQALTAGASCGEQPDGTLVLPGAESELSLRPEEHLKAHLLGAQAHALREARHLSARMHTEVQELCGAVLHDVQQKKQDFEEYPAACKPSDYNQQCVRNGLRGGLEKVARRTHENLKSLTNASRTPEERLQSAKAAQLEKIDSVMIMLEKLRAETLLVFQEAQETEKVACEASEAAVLSLAPALEYVDRFVQHVAKEVEHETTQALQVHGDKLEELKLEQLCFVNANDSPQRNPIFAKVIEDIASTERLLEEHSSRSESHSDFLKDWKDVMAVMPAQTPLPSTSGKHWLWSRIFSHQ